MLTGKELKEENDLSGRQWLKKLGLFWVIVSDLVGYTGAGLFIGYLAWKKLNAPWGALLLGSLGGLAIAMYHLYVISQKEM